MFGEYKRRCVKKAVKKQNKRLRKEDTKMFEYTRNITNTGRIIYMAGGDTTVVAQTISNYKWSAHTKNQPHKSVLEFVIQ